MLPRNTTGRTTVGVVAGLLAAASPLALRQAIAGPASPPAPAGHYTLTPTTGAGATATTVSPATSSTSASAKTVTVTTGTKSGTTAFNSFQNFVVGSGVSVNLVLPTGTKNLVNLVATQVNVDGTLYSSVTTASNNKVIGGHVFFVAPNGFILGPDGSINVGALTVETANVNSVAGGSFDTTLGGQLSNVLGGTVALNGAGGIDIQGVINTSGVNDPSGDGSVSLLTNNAVTIEAGGVINAGGATPLAAFNTVVAGATGLASATGVTTADGGDVILTGGGVDVAGAVHADAAGAGNAGTVAVNATSLTLESTGTISASGDPTGSGSGGGISLASTGDASIQGQVHADALGTGVGGYVAIIGSTVEVGSAAKVTTVATSNGGVPDIFLNSTTGATDIAGTLSASQTGSIGVVSAGNLTLESSSNVTEGYDLSLQAAQTLDVKTAPAVGRSYFVTAQSFADNALAPAFSAQNGADFAIDSTGAAPFAVAALTAPGSLTITTAGEMDVNGSLASTGGSLSLTATTGNLTVASGASLTAGQSVTLSAAAGTLSTPASASVGSDYSVTARTFAGKALSPAFGANGGDFTIDSTGASALQLGALTAPGALSITTAGPLTLAGALNATTSIDLTVGGALAVTSAGSVTAAATGGNVSAITIAATGDANIAGPIASTNASSSAVSATVTVSGATVELPSTGSITANAAGGVNTVEVTTTSGPLAVGGNISAVAGSISLVSAGALTLANGSIEAAPDLTLSAANTLNVVTAQAASDAYAVTAQTFAGAALHPTLSSGASFTIDSTATGAFDPTFLNALSAPGALTITAAGPMNVAGSITGTGSVSLSAPDGALGVTTPISVGGSYSVTAQSFTGKALSPSFTPASTGDLTVTSTATGGVFDPTTLNALTAPGSVTVTSAEPMSVAGSLTATAGSVSLEAQSGALTVGTTATITAAQDINVAAPLGTLDVQIRPQVNAGYSATGQSFLANPLTGHYALDPKFLSATVGDFTIVSTSSTAFDPSTINPSGLPTTPGTLSVIAADDLNVTGTLRAASISLDALTGDLTVESNATLSTTQNLTLMAPLGTLTLDKALNANDLTIVAQTFAPNVIGGDASATKDLTITGTSTSTPLTLTTAVSAPGTLTINANAIDVEANLTATQGDIDLNAKPTGVTQSGAITEVASITIGATSAAKLKAGGNINVTADASATASTTAIPTSLSAFVESGVGDVGHLLGLLTGLSGGYVEGDGTSTITIGSNATLDAQGSITALASTTSKADEPVIALSTSAKKRPLSIAVNYAEINATSTVSVASGATLDAGTAAGDVLSLIAQNTGTLSATSFTYRSATGSSSAMADSIALGFADVTSSVSVANGANLSANAIKAVAYNNDSFAVSATTYATKGAVVGAAIAYKDTTTSATTKFEANVGSSTANGGSLTVQAIDDTSNNVASATDGTGPTISGQILDAVSAPVSTASGLLSSIGSSTPSPVSSSRDVNLRLGAAVAVNQSSGSATAVLGGDAASPSAVYSNGDVVVAAVESDLGARSNAGSEVASEQPSTAPGAGEGAGPVSNEGSSGASKISVSAAVAVGIYDQSATAEIAPSTTVDAARIAVDAQTLQPISDNFISSFTDPSVGSILSHINPNLGVVNDILTSYANSTAAGTSLAISGSANVFDTTSTTTAWVGQGAILTTASGATPSWTATLQDGTTLGGSGPTPTPGGDAYTSAPAWTTGLVVDAYAESSSIDVGGNIGIISTLKTIFGYGPAQNGSVSVGGTFNGVFDSDTTIAGIDTGANVTANTGLAVNAITDNEIIALAPGSGTGTGVGVTGLVSYLQIDNTTHAEVSNGATINASCATGSCLTVNAEQTFELVNVAADYVGAGSVAVGIGAAADKISGDTSAFIGDTAPDAPALTGYAAPVAATTAGTITTNSLEVFAETTGFSSVVGVAGAKANGAPPTTYPAPASPDFSLGGALPVSLGASADAGAAGAAGGEGAAEGGAAGDAASGTGAAKGSSQSFNLAIAGSLALSFTHMNTTAEVAGLGSSKQITIRPQSGGATTTLVEAVDNPLFVAGAGAGVAVSPNPDGPEGEDSLNVGIAGAVTLQEPDNHALAALDYANLTAAQSTNVESLVGGVEVSAAVAVALSQGAGAGVAGSFSILLDSDQANAQTEGSTIVGASGGASTFALTAYQDTDLGVGGVGVGKAMGFGVGLALDYVSLSNPSSGDAVQALVSDSSITGMTEAAGTNGANATPGISVYAGDASVLVAAAASAGLGQGVGSVGLEGSGAYVTLDRTVDAEVNGSSILTAATPTPTNSQTLGDTISVVADGNRLSALDGVLNRPTQYDGYDFTGQTSNPGAIESVSSNGSSNPLTVGSGQGNLIIVAAGAGGEGGSVFGASFAGANLEDTHEALVTSSTLSATGTGGAIDVAATDNSLVIGAAVGVALGSQLSGVGSVTVLTSSDTTTTTVSGSTLTAPTITVRANDAATLASLAGAYASGMDAGDASVAVLTADGQSNATVSGSTLNVSKLLNVAAADNGLLVDVAVAGASSSGLAVEGAGTINTIGQSAVALMSGDSVPAAVPATPTSTVDVQAASDQTIWTGALAVGFSDAGAAGVGFATNDLIGNGQGVRASATVDGGSYGVKDLLVTATAGATVDAVAAGIEVAGSGAFGDAGSIVTNVSAGSVSATIDDGAQVSALDNVEVAATSTDTINVVAGALGVGGSAEGLGVSVVTNVLDGSTAASIDSASVTALASNSADTVSVDSGLQKSPVDLSGWDNANNPVSLTFAASDSLPLATQTVTGVAVDAASAERPAVVALSLGFANATAGAVNVVTNVLSGSTSAYLNDAQLNQGAGTAGAGQAVDVLASDNAFATGLVGSIAGSGSGSAFAAAVNTVFFSRDVQAYTDGSTVGATGAVAVTATSFQGAEGLTIGGGLGEIAAAASVTLANFAADTSAYGEGGSITAGSLQVTATNTEGANIATGALAIGSTAVGGAFDVTNSNNQTYAELGRASPATLTDNTIDGVSVTAGSTSVKGISNSNWYLYTIGGSLAGSVGVAAMGGLVLSANDTEAGVYGGSVLGLGSTQSAPVAESSLTVAANATTNATMVTGALAIGGSTGIGASIGVILDSSSVGATLDQTTADANTLNVNAEWDRNLGETLITGGIGVDVGIGATVGVILVGGGEAGGYGEQAFDELLPTLSNVSSNSSGAMSGSLGSGGDKLSATGTSDVTQGLSTQQEALANKAGTVATPASLADVAHSSILASVQDSKLTGQNVQVTATAKTATSQLDGALAAGTVGVGGGVGYTALTDNITASIDPASKVTAATIGVAATTGNLGVTDAADVNAYVGSIGAVGLGAAVAVVNDDMDVNAQAGGALTGATTPTGGLTVSATDTTTAKTQDYSLTVGAVAAGAAVSEITKDGSVEAQILPTTSGPATAVTDFTVVSVMASASGGLAANGVAAGGGLGLALDGAYVSAEDGDSVEALLGAGSYGATAGGVNVTATRTPFASAQALGAALSAGVGAGAGIAVSTVDGHDYAQVAGGANFADGASLSVTALMRQDSSGHYSATATSTAGAGGLLAGADASVATAKNSSSIQATVETNVGFGSGDGAAAADNLTIIADRDTSQYAMATGVAVGGFLALGASVAEADSSGDITATLGANLHSLAVGKPVIMNTLTVEAGTGLTTATPSISSAGTDDRVSANSVAGGGAAIAGTAAVANTSQTANVSAIIQDFTAPTQNAPLSTIVAIGGANVLTNYLYDATAVVDTTQAALLGASGASATRTMSPIVDTTVGANLALETDGDLLVSSYVGALISGSTKTGAGGFANGNAANSTSNVDPVVTVTIGSNSELLVLGDPTNNPGSLKIVLGDSVVGSDSGTMTTGGFLEGPFVVSTINADLTNIINIDAGASLLSVGALTVGDYVLSNVSTTADVSTYGGVGAAGGTSTSNVTANNTVNLGNNVSLDSYGNITVAAGQSGDGFESTTLNAYATTDVYNYTAIPITVSDAANASTTNNSNLNAGQGVDIEGVANVNLIAYDTNGNPQASGHGHNPYLSIFGLTTSDSNVSQSTTSQITFDGVAHAGVLADQTITIGANGAITLGGALGSGSMPHLLAELLQPALNGAAAVSGTLDTYDSLLSQIAAEQVIVSNVGNVYTATQVDTAEAAITGLDLLLESAPYTSTLVYVGPQGGGSSTGTDSAFNAIAQQENILYSSTSTAAQKAAAATLINNLEALENGSGGSDYATVKVGVAVPAVTIGPIYAAAGNLTLQAQTFTDTDTAANGLTAQGAVQVTVTDARSANGYDLVTGPIMVPTQDATGGYVYFLGGDKAPATAAVVNQIGAGGTPAVLIQNTAVTGSSPLIIINSEIDNYGGSVTINNANGDIAQYAEVNADSLNIAAPNGNYVVPGLNGTATVGGAPESLWAGYELVSASTSGQNLANAEANAQFGAASGANGNIGAFNQYLFSDYYYNNQSSETLVNGVPKGAAAQVLGINAGCSGSTCVNYVLAYNNLPDPGTGAQNFDNSDFGFNQVPIVKTSSTASLASALLINDTSAGISARNVIISASNINVNSTIQAGASNWSALITGTNTYGGNTLAQEIALLNNQYTMGMIGGGNVDVSGYVTAYGGTQRIPVAYDVGSQQLVLGDVKGGAGGLVELAGGIANTSATSGMIQVNNGLASITVGNSTGITLDVNNLNAGAPSPAEVVITDSNKLTGPHSAPLTTWYVEPVGGAESEYTDSSLLQAGQTVTVGAAVPTGANSVTVGSYMPAANLRYTWVDQYTDQRTLNVQGSYAYNWSANGWNATGGGEISSLFSIVKNGDALPFFTTSLSGTITSAFDGSFTIGCGCRGLPGNNGSYIFYDLAPTALQVTETSSVKADNAIKVGFSGPTTGTIYVQSNGSIDIVGSVANVQGTTTLNVSSSSGAIQEAGGSITAQTLILQAPVIGSSTTGGGGPLNVTLVAGNSLTAKSKSGGLDLAITGTANLATISAANGDVIITATQGIEDGAGATGISGDNITLNGGAGGVGDVGQALLVGATVGSTTTEAQHGVVNVTASGAIDIEKTSGDLLLGQIASQTAGVTLVADTGSIANATTAFTVNTAQATALANEYSALNLQNASKAIAQTITPIDKQVDSDYNEYWSIVRNATISSGKISLTPTQTLLFSAQAFAANSTLTTADHNLLAQIVANSTITFVAGAPTVTLTAGQQAVFSAEVQAAENLTGLPTASQINSYVQSKYSAYYATTTSYVLGQYNAINTYITTTFGSTPPAGFYKSYVSNYAYYLTAASDPTLYAQVTYGAGAWTTTQLADSINSDAVVPTSNTQILSQAPNISGKTITLRAPQGQIGNNLALNVTSADGVLSNGGGTLTFNLNPATLTTTDLDVLAAAAPGDLTVNYSGTTPVSVSAALPHLVGVAAPGATTPTLTATALGNIYLGSDGPGALAGIDSVDGQARVEFGQSITNAAGGYPAIAAGFLVIESGNGNIGTATNPLTTSLYYAAGSNNPAPILDSARAGGDIYIEEIPDLRQPSHTEADNLNVGVAFANGLLNLSAPYGAIQSGLPSAAGAVRLQAANIDFDALGDIGSAANPLQIETSGQLVAANDTNLKTAAHPGGDALSGTTDLYLVTPVNLDLGQSTLNGFTSLAPLEEPTTNPSVTTPATGVGFTFLDPYYSAAGVSVTATGSVTIDGVQTSPATPAASIGSYNGAIAINATSIGIGAGAAVTTSGPAGGTITLTTTSGDIDLGTSGSIRGHVVTASSAGAINLGDGATVAAFTSGADTTPASLSLIATGTLTAGDDDAISSAGSAYLQGQTVALGNADAVGATGTLLVFGVAGLTGLDNDTLTGGGGVTLLSPTMTFGNALTASAGSGTLTATATGGAMTFGATANLTGPAVLLTAQGPLTLGANGAVKASITDANLSAASINLTSQDSVTASRNVAVAASGTLTAGPQISLLAANGDTTVTAASATFGQLADIEADSGTVSIVAKPLTLAVGSNSTVIGRSIVLTGGSTVSFGADDNVKATGTSLQITGLNVTLGAADTLQSQNTLTVSAAGTLTAGAADVIVAGGAATLSGAQVTLGQQLSANVSGGLTLTASQGALGVLSNATIVAGSLTATGQGGISFGDSDSLTIYGPMSWSSSQAVAFGSSDVIRVSATLTGTSGALTFGYGTTVNASSMSLTSSQGMTLAALTAGSSITLNAGGSVQSNNSGVTNLTASNVNVTASGNVGASNSQQLVVQAPTINVKAPGRSVWLKTLGSVITRSITAGTIYVNGQSVKSN